MRRKHMNPKKQTVDVAVHPEDTATIVCSVQTQHNMLQSVQQTAEPPSGSHCQWKNIIKIFLICAICSDKRKTIGTNRTSSPVSLSAASGSAPRSAVLSLAIVSSSPPPPSQEENTARHCPRPPLSWRQRESSSQLAASVNRATVPQTDRQTVQAALFREELSLMVSGLNQCSLDWEQLLFGLNTCAAAQTVCSQVEHETDFHLHLVSVQVRTCFWWSCFKLHTFLHWMGSTTSVDLHTGHENHVMVCAILLTVTHIHKGHSPIFDI